MCILQNEEVTKLRNVPVSLEKSNGHRIRHISNNNGLSRVGPDAAEIHAITIQHCRAEDCLAIDME